MSLYNPVLCIKKLVEKRGAVAAFDLVINYFNFVTFPKMYLISSDLTDILPHLLIPCIFHNYELCIRLCGASQTFGFSLFCKSNDLILLCSLNAQYVISVTRVTKTFAVL